MSTDPPRHRHEHVLVSIHNEQGLDFAVLERPGPLRVLVRNHTGASYRLAGHAGPNLPPRIRVGFAGAGAGVELDPGAVSCPGWQVQGWSGGELDLVPASPYGWWLDGETLAVSLGTVVVHGQPGLGMVEVTLEQFGPGVDGAYPVALVRLPAQGAAGDALAAEWLGDGGGDGSASPGSLVVTPRRAAPRVNTLRLRLTPPGAGELFLSFATAGAQALRPIGSPGRADDVVVEGAGGWTAERTASAGMPVWRLSGGQGPAEVRLTQVVSDRPAGEAHLAAYATAPGASGWAVVPVILVEASVIINSFTADNQTFNNLTAPASVLLSWNVSNATTVTLSTVGTVDSVVTNFQVFVEQTTTFVLTAFDASLANIASASVTVAVNPGLVSRMVPAGTILVWKGGLDSIPANWALCDGTNGTPDLRDRFLMGAGGGQAPGQFGDADTHTHAIPAVSNTFQTSSDGAHTHGMPTNWYARSLSSGNKTGIDTSGTFNNNTQSQSAGTHTHTVSVGFAAFTSSPNNGQVRPPWFALAYIMKLPYATS